MQGHQEQLAHLQPEVNLLPRASCSLETQAKPHRQELCRRLHKQEVAGWKHCPAKKGRSERDVAKARGRWTVVSSYVKVGE